MREIIIYRPKDCPFKNDDDEGRYCNLDDGPYDCKGWDEFLSKDCPLKLQNIIIVKIEE